MDTDYKNLDGFESAAITVAVAGILLIGTLAFLGLSYNQQSYFVSALNVLDIHEQAEQSAQDIQFAMSVPEEFYKQVYVAFTQVAVLPDETVNSVIQWASNIQVAFSQFQNYSDQVTFEYNFINQPARQIAYTNVIPDLGLVAGASVDLSGSVLAPHCIPRQAEQVKSSAEYQPPDINLIRNEINKIKSLIKVE